MIKGLRRILSHGLARFIAEDCTGSDRARVSYDPQQQYRTVVMQQGRVTLEADWNESQQIQSEEARNETLDIVGRTGTCDDGFRITQDLAAPDFHIEAGTMYLGGERIHLAPRTSYSEQPDWLSPDPPNPSPPADELIYLHLIEQEVSAVEDSDLKDVALGGPDTAQRTRILRRIERLAVPSLDCGEALKQAIQQWNAAGLDLLPKSLRLIPQAMLKVGFDPTGTAPDPCDPTVQGGFLGALNQLIRIQISGSTSFLWGYDNASFLYRVNVVDLSTLQLQSAPVDAFHQPRAQQAVEIILPTARLNNGEYVAAGSGLVQTLLAAYDPQTQQIKLPTPLPSSFQSANPPPRVYLRVWEQELTFTPNVPIDLGTTGVQVTLQPGTGGAFHVGDFWHFAVRPGAGQTVYPERYVSAFQPAEGPRQWVCPLAVITWPVNVGGTAIVQDCRQTFYPLVDELRVTHVLVQNDYGQSIPLANGDTVKANDLANGLLLLLKKQIDPASATTASCFLTMEVPFAVGYEAVGFQPIVLAASVGTPDPKTIAWVPTPGSQQFLISQLPKTTVVGVPFTHDWDLFPATTSAATWQYVMENAEANVTASDPQAFAGFMAVNNQIIGAGVAKLTMSVSPPFIQNAGGYVGVVFNFAGINDFWLFTFSAYAQSSESAGFAGYFLSCVLTHYQNGAVAQTTTGPQTSTHSLGVVFEDPTTLGFTITQTPGAAPSFSMSYTLTSSAPTPPFQVSFTSAPTTLVTGSSVGLVSNWTGRTDFTALEIDYNDGHSQVFLPPAGSGPILTRLTVKRDFLRPASAVLAPFSRGDQLPAPRPDFSMWFWVLPTVAGYGYGATSQTGIGTELL